MFRITARSKRHGFTLIELLVVIAIITVLMALAAGTYIRVSAAQQVSRTEDAIRMIDKSMRDHWDFVKRDADREFDTIDPTTLQAIYNLANGDTDRARVLWRIFRLTEAFPQSYREVLDALTNNDGVLNKTIYGYSAKGPQPAQGGTPWYWIPPERRKYLKAFSIRISTPNAGFNKPETQSAACLYLSLTQLNRNGNLRLTEEHLPANVADTDGDGVREFVDNFGPVKPLTFIRFPIWSKNKFLLPGIAKFELPLTQEMSTFNPQKPANASFGDPLDPNGLLQQQVIVSVGGVPKTFPWYNAPYTGNMAPTDPPPNFLPNMRNGDVLAQLCSHPLPRAAEYMGQPYNLGFQPYYMPIVISSGADGTYDTPDDVVSFRLRVGARGG
jgi:prepilin-type N-terminal cleavage/methylation domain-containing protein